MAALTSIAESIKLLIPMRGNEYTDHVDLEGAKGGY